MHNKHERKSGVTARAIFIALILIPFNCYWCIRRGEIWSNTPTTLSLIYSAVFTLFFLTLFNIIVLKRFFARHALSQGELLTIYFMICLASIMSGFDTIQVFSSVIGHARWFATPENEWKNLLGPYLPDWLSVSDMKALEGYYEGDSTFYTASHVKAWLKPALFWSAFLVLIAWVVLCFNVILRRQWIEKEKLAYPIIQIPLSMTKGGGSLSLFRNKLFWIAFIAAGTLDTINSLHILYPSIPGIQNRGLRIDQFFTEKPWNAIGILRVEIMPFAMGMAFFLPLNLCFSVWFLFLFQKILKVMLSALGIQSSHFYIGAYTELLPYHSQQTSGGYFALGVLALWKSRRHLMQMGKMIFERKADANNASEPMSYRTALLGIFLGITFLIAFCFKAGMSLWVIGIFFFFFFVTSIGIAKMRAQLGPPSHDMWSASSDQVIMSVFGSRRVGPSNIAMFTLLYGITRSQRNQPMPHQLEGFKMAEKTGINTRRLIYVLMLASIVGAIAGFWIILDRAYQFGLSHTTRPGFAGEIFAKAQSWIYYPSNTKVDETIAMFFGFGFTMFLAAMRRFLWWPIHPVAYPLILLDYTVRMLWINFIIAWLVKWVALKYGGLKSYQSIIPFFSGLLLGEFIIGGGWSLIGVLFNIPVYAFWH